MQNLTLRVGSQLRISMSEFQEITMELTQEPILKITEIVFPNPQLGQNAVEHRILGGGFKIGTLLINKVLLNKQSL